MKKVLVFTSTFPSFAPGDTTPSFVYELSQNLAKKGLDIIVLTPRVPGSKTYEVKDGMKIYRYPYFFKSSREKINDGAILPNIKKNKRLLFQIPFLLISGFFALIKVVKKEKIETIHAHRLIAQGLLACIYKKIRNKEIKILCTSHGSDIHSLGGRFMNLLKRFVLNTSDHITVVSNYLKDEVKKLGVTNPIDVISMGVNVNKFNSKFYDEIIKKENNIKDKFLLYVGRFDPEKGVMYLLEAMPEVIKRYPDIKLMLIGGGSLEPELRKQAMKLKIENNLIRKGWVDHANLPPYFATADIFILPSLKESFGLVLVEASLSGSIVIASKLDGIQDIIDGKKIGFFVEPGNNISISNKINYVLDKLKENKQSMSDGIIDQIKKKFSWDVISEKYFILLNSHKRYDNDNTNKV